MTEKTKRILHTVGNGLLIVWVSLISIESPKWFGWIWLNISGNGKGYGYELGAEKGVYILVGFITLFIYLIALVVPGLVLSSNLRKKNKWLAFIPLFLTE